MDEYVKQAKDFLESCNVKRQYKSLCRCFTPEQIEAMQEIQ